MAHKKGGGVFPHGRDSADYGLESVNLVGELVISGNI
jgi:ribosomal protein L27